MFSLYLGNSLEDYIYIYWLSFFFFSIEVLKLCQLPILNSFIQQCFSPWCKVNWMKFRPLVYLGPCQTSMIELFCKYRWLFLGVHHICFTEFWMHLWNIFDILMVTDMFKKRSPPWHCKDWKIINFCFIVLAFTEIVGYFCNIGTKIKKCVMKFELSIDLDKSYNS